MTNWSGRREVLCDLIEGGLDEGERAMSPEDDLNRERPLLLDPCRDDPDQYLTYNGLGEVVAVRDKPQGLATIAVFHLERLAAR